jgi:hypothetical protein
MANDGTEWHDPRCALQLSMRSPATGKHVLENSKLPTTCICKELPERRLARNNSLPLKSSIERQKRNGQLVSGDDLDHRNGAEVVPGADVASPVRRQWRSQYSHCDRVSNALEVEH